MSLHRMFEFSSIMDRVLGALSLRQSVIADNIANANTPGFKRGDVDFAAVLRQVEGRQLALRSSDPRHLAHQAGGRAEGLVVREQATSMRNDGNNVDIEREMALLAETTIRYNTLVEYLTRRLRDVRTAINAGRR